MKKIAENGRIREWPAATQAWLLDVQDAKYTLSDMVQKIINDKMPIEDAQEREGLVAEPTTLTLPPLPPPQALAELPTGRPVPTPAPPFSPPTPSTPVPSSSCPWR